LDGLVNEVSSTQGSLLRNLFGLDGVCELGGESDMGNRYIVKDKVEPGSAFCQVFSHEARDLIL
jgi:hypothetical protein